MESIGEDVRPLLNVKKTIVTPTGVTSVTSRTTLDSMPSSSPLTIEAVKEELNRICDMFKSREIGGDQVVRRVERVLLKEGSARVKQMQSILSKRVEASLGLHLCGLWRQCKRKCQYAGNLSKWREEIKVYRPFGEAVPEMWTMRGLVSHAMNNAHNQSLESLKTRLSETEEELERACSRRRRSDSDKVDREEAFKGLLAHMDFSAKESSMSPTLMKISVSSSSASSSSSVGVLNDIIDESNTASSRGSQTQFGSRSKFRPRVSPSIKAAAMLSLPPILNIDDDDDDDDEEEEKETERGATKKDWPYRDVFPQFLRESSDEREGNLSVIMNHMKQIQHDERSKIKILDKETVVVKHEKTKKSVHSSIVVKVSSWFAMFALWLSKMSLRRKVLIAIAVFGILSRLSSGPGRSVIRSGVSSDVRARGVARFLPAGSIFRRMQEKLRVQAPPHRRGPGGIARFLPPESIFSRLNRK